MAEFKHNLMLHPRTAAQAQAFVQKPSHALLITGSLGSGKPALARALAASLLGVEEENLTNYPYFWWLGVPENKQEIPVEAVRELTENLKLKTPGRAAIRRIVV